MKLFFTLFLAVSASAVQFPNSVFVFGPENNFDISAFTKSHAPSISSPSDVEAIMHWSGYYSMNPQLVVSLMLEKDIAVEDLEEFLAPYYTEYYQAQKIDEEHAASVSLEKNLGRDGAQRIVGTFQKLFPETSLDAPFVSVNDIDPPTDMNFPYPQGVSWFFNGIHTWTGSTDGSPMSSIDVTRTWSLRWGHDTSRDFITSLHIGTVQVFSSCSVRINHPNGFSSHYYHLDNVTVSTGQSIDTNTPIAVYANQQNQALCNGGSSTGPHLHVALLYNGNYYTMHNSYMSGYRLNAGRFSYDSSNSMYLERNGQRFYAYQASLRRDRGRSTNTTQN